MPTETLKLRYQFDNQAQLLRHAHLLEGGRFALFYPSSRADLPTHGPVVLQVNVADSGQTMLLRGKVMSRISGNSLDGLWLEFPEKRLLQIISTRLVSARSQRRYESDILVRVNTGQSTVLSKLLDISACGARVGNSPRATLNQTVDVSLMISRPDCPTQLGQARVVRVGDRELGLQFCREDALTRRAMLRLVGTVEQEWLKVLAVDHPALCCRKGIVLQPQLPRVREDVAIKRLG